MTREKIRLKSIKHIGLVVRDLRKTMKQSWNNLGIGPWSVFTLKPPEFTVIVRGKPMDLSLMVAFATVGSVNLELIQPLTENNIYTRFLADKGEGMHHIASYEVEDLDSQVDLLEKQGIDVLLRGAWKGSTFAYMDTRKVFGAVLELVKRTEKFPEPVDTYP
jgi:methylmalonyl-CoA/ethylmalonyl-CoA epimerase